jgi:hypothetical protein
LSGFASLAQGKWAAWLRRQHLADRLPDDFAAVVDAVVHIADPILSGRAINLIWEPEKQTWISQTPLTERHGLRLVIDREN